tara:strand:+ start:475 stop:594 length:120 start_codon:yes stop_codon:yes gene_type:complete
MDKRGRKGKRKNVYGKNGEKRVGPQKHLQFPNERRSGGE